jgi:hypothetical protein
MDKWKANANKIKDQLETDKTMSTKKVSRLKEDMSYYNKLSAEEVNKHKKKMSGVK